MDPHSDSPKSASNETVAFFKGTSVGGRLLALLWGVAMAFALVVNLLKSHFPRVAYNYTMETLLPHPVLMLIGWIGLLLLFLIIKKIWKESQKPLVNSIVGHYPIAVISVCFFFLQLYFVYNYYFETDWDVQVLLDTARNIAYGGNINQNSWYYSNYPNNLLLTCFFSAILFVARPLHLGAHDFFAIIVVQSLISVMTFLMLYQLCIKMWKRRDLAYFACCIYLIIVGLSPWVSIPYSDSWGLLFPVLLLMLRYGCHGERKSLWMWFWLSIVAYLGYKIKPQVIFTFIGILLVDGVSLWKELRWNKTNKLIVFKYLLPIFCGLLISVALVFVLEKSTRIHCDRTQSMGPTHYLMMGLNRNSIGGYCDDDLTFSRSFATPSARSAGNLKESVRRVKEMGAGGFGELMCEKMLVNYYDGTFFWGKEGWFFKTVFPEKNQHLSPFLRNLYYNRLIHGKYYPWWCSFSTAVWLGLLLLAFSAMFGKWNNSLRIIAISILLLTLYELLFEARSRYLYAYTPFYIIMAVQGAETMVEKWSAWRKKKVSTGRTR